MGFQGPHLDMPLVEERERSGVFIHRMMKGWGQSHYLQAGKFVVQQ